MSDTKEQDIRKLLEAYWKGETSLEEEKTLKEYFHFAKVPDDLQETACFFHSLSNSTGQELGDDFDNEILSRINSKGGATVKRMSFFHQHWKGMAAAVLVLIVGSWLIWSLGADQKGSDRIYTAEGNVEQAEVEAAFEETKQALFMLSGKFQRGKEEVKKLEKFNQATEEIKDTSNE